jgi:uncharacterized protein
VLEDAEIIQVSDAEVRGPHLLAGFLGAGLVGTIAVNQIIAGLKLAEVGYVRSRFVPPAAVFFDGKLRHPFRIYAGTEAHVIALICELPIRADGLQAVAKAIADWAESKSVNDVIVLDGIPVRGIPKTRRTYCAAEEERCKELASRGIQIVESGYIGGLGGALLSECLVRKLDGVAMLTPATTFIPDPGGAAELVNSFNKIYGFNVATEELERKATDIKNQLKEMATKYRKSVESEQKRYTPEGIYT